MIRPQWVAKILDRFDAETKPHSEIEIAEELGNERAKKLEEIPEEEWNGFLAEHSVFFLREITDGTSIWGSYFGPMAELSQGDKTIYVPDISALVPEVIDYWGQRSLESKNPMMRARYADAAWDLAGVIANVKPNHEHARAAIDSYIEATDGSLYTIEVEAANWLSRALSLARSVQDKSRIQNAVDAILAFHKKSLQPRHVGVWVLPFDILYGEKSLLSEAQENQIIAELESMLARLTVMKEVDSEFDPFGAQAAGERLAQHYKRKGDPDNARRVLKSYGGAFQQLAEKAVPMLAIAWLQPVIEKYEQEGMKAEAEELRLFMLKKGENITSDMKEYSVQVNIKKEDLEEISRELIAQGDLAVSLMRIGGYFIPGANSARKMLDEQKRVAPLFSLTPITVVDRSGRPVAKASSVEDQSEGRLYRQLAQNVGFYQPFLSYVLGTLIAEFQPAVDDILDVLYLSPLFQIDRRAILHAGLSAYLAKDFLKSIHILVFQIEEILRTLVVLMGIPPHKSVPRHPGISDVKNMNDVLDDGRVRGALTENVWTYLKVLYVERRGINLRNDLAHGLVPVEGFNQAIADQVFHSLVVLSLLRKAEPPNAAESVGR